MSLLLALALLAAACGGSGGTETTEAGGDTEAAEGSGDTEAAEGSGDTEAAGAGEDVRIGYSVFDMAQPYWQAYAQGIEDAGQERGWEVLVSDQNSEQARQVSGSADLIAQGISALIVSPVQPDALPATIDAAKAQDIPVIIGDVGAVGDYDVFILSDNSEGGATAAQYIVEQLGDAEGTKQVGVITLHPGSAVGRARAEGFTNELANHEDFEVVAELSGEDTVEGGFSVTQDILSANPEVQAIYAGNDPEAIGAVQALAEAGRDDVIVVGFNGDPPALELIEQGDMAATIAQDPYGQGQRAVELAEQLMQGESVEYDDEEQRAVFFPVTLVTAENVGEFQ